MNEVTLEVAAGLNSTLSQVTSALRWVLACLTSVLLDEEGQVSTRSLQQVRETAVTGWTDLIWWLGFTPLQSHVFKAFAIILVVNFVLITVFWYVYAQRISHTLSYNSLRIVEDILKRNTNFKINKDNPARP